MEITYTQQHTYSLDLKTPAQRRELADHLDITEKKMRKLVEEGDLFDEYGDQLTEWVASKSGEAEVTAHEDIDIDQINW